MDESVMIFKYQGCKPKHLWHVMKEKEGNNSLVEGRQLIEGGLEACYVRVSPVGDRWNSSLQAGEVPRYG